MLLPLVCMLKFDLLLLVLEPTQKGKEVWKQYARLAQAAGVYDQLLHLGINV